MKDKLYEELKEHYANNLEEIENVISYFQERLDSEKELEDYRFEVNRKYNEYLEKTENRNTSYGELIYIQDLSREELENLENEIDSELEEDK